MNKTLFAKEMKSTFKITLIFIAVLTMYFSVIISMFDPKLGDSLTLMAQSMPELFASFGMLSDTSTLISFLSTYLYGFLLIVFPLVCIALLVHHLVGRYLTNGSMAYLLATPNSRTRIITTQIVVLLTNLLILLVFIVLLGIGLCEMMFPGDLDIHHFLILNACVLCLWIFLASLCFFFTTCFSGTIYGYGGIGLCILFILMNMIAEVGDKIKFLNYINPLKLFVPSDIIAGANNAVLHSGILAVAGVIIIIVGVYYFKRRNLSL